MSAMPGTGKSTFIRENELDAITLSLDNFRTIYAGNTTDYNGNVILSGRNEDLVFAKFNEALNSRMQNGGTLFIDNLNANETSIDYLHPLMEKYDYDYRIVRFEIQPMDFYIARNNQRESFKRLPQESLDRIYNEFTTKGFKHPEFIITPAQAIAEVKATPNDLIRDISSYDKIHFIGDLQGSYYPIEKYLKDEGGLKRNELYVFVGDYIDRGIQNDKCLAFINEHKDKENVILIMGNHEKHIYNYAYNLRRPATEFLTGTLPQLHKAKMDKDFLKGVLKNMELFSFLQYEDKKIFVSHAGLASVPKYPHLLNHDEFMKGFGDYSYNIDAKFQELNANNEWYQVHGHRNAHKLTFSSYPKSFALEADVEFGGNLPVLRLNQDGFNGVYVLNKIFNKEMIMREEKEKDMFESKKLDGDIGQFLQNKMNYKQSGLEMIESLRNNDLIRERKFEDLPHISSFNFTKQAFFDKKFDDELVIHARGLFLNNETGEIVARGFEKFFNINERGIESAKIENVKSHFKAPLRLYEKENGFLGIIGYDSSNNNLVFASKSDIGGEFSNNLKDIAKKQFNEGELEYLKIFANKHNVNYLFEVNDPVNDPHIIEYKNEHLVLIGVVKREFQFTQMKYEAMEKFASGFKNLPIKKKFVNFENLDNFEKFYNAVSKESALTTKRKLEGYVVEDADCNMIKIKLPYYNFWKCMRGFTEQINRSIEKDKPYDIANTVKNHFLINDSDKEFAVKFLENFKSLPEDKRKRSIIDLRNEYLEQNPLELENSKNTVKKKMKP